MALETPYFDSFCFRIPGLEAPPYLVSEPAISPILRSISSCLRPAITLSMCMLWVWLVSPMLWALLVSKASEVRELKRLAAFLVQCRPGKNLSLKSMLLIIASSAFLPCACDMNTFLIYWVEYLSVWGILLIRLSKSRNVTLFSMVIWGYPILAKISSNELKFRRISSFISLYICSTSLSSIKFLSLKLSSDLRMI